MNCQCKNNQKVKVNIKNTESENCISVENIVRPVLEKIETQLGLFKCYSRVIPNETKLIDFIFDKGFCNLDIKSETYVNNKKVNFIMSSSSNIMITANLTA